MKNFMLGIVFGWTAYKYSGVVATAIDKAIKKLDEETASA